MKLYQIMQKHALSLALWKFTHLWTSVNFSLKKPAFDVFGSKTQSYIFLVEDPVVVDLPLIHPHLFFIAERMWRKITQTKHQCLVRIKLIGERKEDIESVKGNIDRYLCSVNIGTRQKALASEMVGCLYFYIIFNFRCCTFNYLSWTDFHYLSWTDFHYLSWTVSIKPGLQFSFFILVWLLSRDQLFTGFFMLSTVIANMIGFFQSENILT